MAELMIRMSLLDGRWRRACVGVGIGEAKETMGRRFPNLG